MKQINRFVGMAVLFALAACERLPDDAEILKPSQARGLVEQCSRPSPKLGDDEWMPTAREIVMLETSLPKAMAQYNIGGDPNFSRAPNGWRRQYVGYVRDGHRLVYGSFSPYTTSSNYEGKSWQTGYANARICDGGPSYFGVEFDVEKRVFTNIATNGIG